MVLSTPRWVFVWHQCRLPIWTRGSGSRTAARVQGGGSLKTVGHQTILETLEILLSVNYPAAAPFLSLDCHSATLKCAPGDHSPMSKNARPSAEFAGKLAFRSPEGYVTIVLQRKNNGLFLIWNLNLVVQCNTITKHKEDLLRCSVLESNQKPESYKPFNVTACRDMWSF